MTAADLAAFEAAWTETVPNALALATQPWLIRIAAWSGCAQPPGRQSSARPSGPITRSHRASHASPIPQ